MKSRMTRFSILVRIDKSLLSVHLHPNRLRRKIDIGDPSNIATPEVKQEHKAQHNAGSPADLDWAGI